MFRNGTYADLAAYFAHEWLREYHNKNLTTIETTVDINEAIAEENATTGKPWTATVKGKIQSDGNIQTYIVNLYFIGMDNNQTVYKVTKWRVNP